MLDGFITPAGCYMLNSELGIFYALAMTSFFWIGRTRAEGEAVVLVTFNNRLGRGG